MPRAGDLFGVGRGTNDLHNPLRGLLDFSNPMGMISSTAQRVGGQLKTEFDSALDGVVAFIKAETGVDLSGYVALVEGVGDTIGFDLTELASIFSGIDITAPASLVTWLEGAPLNAINIFGTIATASIPPLDASTIVSGEFLSSLIPALPSGWGKTISSGLLSGVLGQGLIPSLTSGWGGTIASSLLSGVLGQGLIPSLTSGWGGTIASALLSGVLSGGLIPNLDASIVTTGQFVQSRIPSLTSGWGGTIASALLNGVLAQGLIPSLTSGWGGTIASGLLSGVLAQGLIPSLSSGWGGTIASSLLSGVLSGGLIPNLDASILTTGTLAQARAAWAAPIDTLIHAWGGTGSGFLPADLAIFASAIPHDYVVGSLGGTNIANTIQLVVDSGVKAVQSNSGLANQTIAQWNNALSAAMGFLGYVPGGATPPNSVAAIASNTDKNVKNRAVQNHPYENIDATINASFPYNDVSTINPLPTIAITQASPASTPVRIRDAGQKQSIRWKGFTGATGTLTGFYVNLYHIDETTGIKTWFYTAPEYHASLAIGTTPQWNSLNLPALAYISTTQGDLIDVEFTVTGTATYNMVGKTHSAQTLPMPGIFPSMVAATRVPPAPTFDQVGAGNAQGNVNSINISWNQPLGASANCVLVGINQGTSAYVAPVVKIGTNTFTQVGTTYNYATNQWLSWWSLFITPGALGTSASVNVTIAGTTANFVAANSISCNGVGSIGAPVTFSGTGTAISQTLSSLVAPVEIVQLWGSNSVTTGSAFSAYSKNSKWNQPFLGNVDQATLIGEMTVSSGTSTTVTGTIQSSTYGSISLVLNGMLQPAPATIANPVNPGAATSAASPATYARLQPWVGLAGTAGATSYSPVTDAYATPGTGISIQNPAVKYPWANNFDIVMCSDGSGGEGGGYPVGGVGGKAGTFTRQTLTRAQIGTSNITLNIGGGSAGTSPGVGSSATGNGVSAVVPGFGTISQAGAAGSGSGLSPSAYGVPGDSAANFTYNDANGTPVTFNGGAGGGAGGQQPGAQPGGGGSGGNSTYMYNFNGGPGGPAEIWIRSYQ